ncbi:MAG TPA: radical SAM protein [Methanocorpusculum sp.]|nr:radical SAM protein [Methanocorpusculum sp.]
MHEVFAKGILSKSNGINVYRGCTHGCIYCDSRSVCYQMKHAFEDVEVKVNAPELLDRALSGKKNKCMIGTGAMCDPYIPLEKNLRITRRCLEVIERRGFGVSVLTKSDLVLEDIELLCAINRKTRAVVSMTLTTWDNGLSKILEPHVCTTQERLCVLKKLSDAGIDTCVWLCPVLPFINDMEENLVRILEGCRDAGVRGILCFGFGVTLREGDREYFYGKLDEHFPGLRGRYEREFGDAYSVMSPDNKRLMGIFCGFCREEGILYKSGDVFSFMERFEDKRQMRLV